MANAAIAGDERGVENDIAVLTAAECCTSALCTCVGNVCLVCTLVIKHDPYHRVLEGVPKDSSSPGRLGESKYPRATRARGDLCSEI